ncbi:hypothetical protein K456DRAFT_428082 [Colletotrichum gloeosporioides 23]|nr:hypothetical protein K456DRAFT_428082 [Colletotrichum gloeosporioides 23]
MLIASKQKPLPLLHPITSPQLSRIPLPASRHDSVVRPPTKQVPEGPKLWFGFSTSPAFFLKHSREFHR